MAAHNKIALIEVNIIVSEKDGKPIIELRRSVKDTELIKAVLYNGLVGRPIKIYPNFKNRLNSINSMIEKGILNYDRENDIWEFNI